MNFDSVDGLQLLLIMKKSSQSRITVNPINWTCILPYNPFDSSNLNNFGRYERERALKSVLFGQGCTMSRVRFYQTSPFYTLEVNFKTYHDKTNELFRVQSISSLRVLHTINVYILRRQNITYITCRVVKEMRSNIIICRWYKWKQVDVKHFKLLIYEIKTKLVTQ